MSYTIDRLTRSDAVLVISIRISIATVDILHELSALPRQRRRTDCSGVADGVVSDRCSVVRGQLVCPIYITVRIGVRGQQICRGRLYGCRRVGVGLF